MHLNRLLATTLVLTAAAIATVVSCSTAGKAPASGDAPAHAVDAPIHAIDAPVHGIDAPGLDAPLLHDAPISVDAPTGTASDLGKLCNDAAGNGDPTMCSALDPLCVGLVATNHFCTEDCGSATVAMPPPGGDAICAMQLPHSGTGQVGCLLHGGGSGSTIVLWACAIRCGMNGGSDLGSCPTGMTCVMNFCE